MRSFLYQIEKNHLPFVNLALINSQLKNNVNNRLISGNWNIVQLNSAYHSIDYMIYFIHFPTIHNISIYVCAIDACYNTNGMVHAC